MSFAITQEEALKTYTSTPRTPQAVKRMTTMLRRHFERDWSDAKGLRRLGVAGGECQPYVEFFDGETILMVRVSVGDSWEAFDNNEALGYSDILLTSEEIAAAVRPVREQRIANKRKEEYVPEET